MITKLLELVCEDRWDANLLETTAYSQHIAAKNRKLMSTTPHSPEGQDIFFFGASFQIIVLTT